MNILIDLSNKIAEYNLIGHRKLSMMKLAIIQGTADNSKVKSILT